MASNPSRAPRPDRDRTVPTSAGSYLKRLLPMLLAAFIGSSLLQLFFPELHFVVRLLILAVLLLGVSVGLERWRSRGSGR